MPFFTSIFFTVFLATLIPENNRAVAVDEDAVLDVVTHAPRQRHTLAIPPEAQQILRRMEMLHTDHLLIDDRPGIQIRRGVMAGGSDQLDAASERTN